MPITLLDYNYPGDYLKPFSMENLPSTVLTVIGVIALASLMRQGSHSSYEGSRIIQKIEPQAEVRSIAQEKAEIEALQKENESLKCDLTEFEGGANHPLLDAPIKCGRIALIEENTLLRARIADGRQKKIERAKTKISPGEILIQRLNQLGYSLYPNLVKKN